MHAGGLTQLGTYFARCAEWFVDQLAIAHVGGALVFFILLEPKTTQTPIWQRSYELTFVRDRNPGAL